MPSREPLPASCSWRAPGEVEPGLAEVRALPAGVVHPDHHGSGIRHRAEAPLALAQGLLGTAALRHVVDDADDADDLAGGIAVRAVGGDRPAALVGLGDRVRHVPGGGGLAGERSLEQGEDPVLLEEGQDVEGLAPEDLLRRQPGHLLHVPVPDDVAQVAVVDDDAFSGAGDDLLAELVGLLELLAGAAALRDVLHDAFVVKQAPGGVTHRPGALAHRDDLAAVALPRELQVVDLALPLEALEKAPARLRIDVDVAQVRGHQAFARGEAEQADQRGVGVENLTRERRPVEADGNALEERAIARLRLVRDAAAHRFLEGGADRGGQAGKVVGMLQDVVVEARLHGRHGELFAAGAGA